MLPDLFCPNCPTYLGPSASACPVCGEQRPAAGDLPAPGQPLWQTRLPGPARGALLASQRVIFSWGQRGRSGGLTALDRQSGLLAWSLETPGPIEGGLVCEGQRLYFGSLGHPAELYALDPASGQIVWRQPLRGGVWSPPVVSEARVIVASDDGGVWAFDRHSGQPLGGGIIFPTPGRGWLAQTGEGLLAFSEHGQIIALQPYRLRPQWTRPLECGCQITSAPAQQGWKFFFGGEGGQVLVLDARRREVEVFAAGLGGVRAAPLPLGDSLLVASQDHHLRLFDRASGLETWKSAPCEHGLTAPPCAADGLAVAAANGGEVILLDLESRQIVWRYRLEVERGLMADPLMDDGLIYVGSDSGQVAALPWHLGQYEWAARQREAAGQYLEAAAFYALAGHNAPPAQRQPRCAQAVESWLLSERPERAAYYLEDDITAPPQRVADVYRRAGVNLSQRQSRLAVDCLLRAANWYKEAGDDDKQRDCRRMASRETRGPHLHISGVTVPTRWQEAVTFKTVVEIENLGKSPARQIWVRFAGVVHNRVWMNFEYLNVDQRVEIEAPLSAVEPGLLVVEARYRDDQGVENTTSSRFEVRAVEPFEGVLIDEDAMVGILSLDKLPGKVIIRGDVGVFKVRTTEPDAADLPAAADFEWPAAREGFTVPGQILVQARQVETKTFTVPAGHWAVFLADEAVIASLAPGRYARKKFPLLQGRLTGPQPAWKAVLFRQAPFRLAYRLGPFRTREGVRVGVECGLTARLDDREPFEIWQGILGQGEQLTSDDLTGWLTGQIIGSLAQWVAAQPEASLTPGFARRDAIMLSLQEALRQTHARYGLLVDDPLWWLDFVIPERQRRDDRRAAVYWRQQEMA